VFTPLAGVLLGDWLGLLWRHGRSIPPRYWAKAAFTTLMASMNSPVAACERVRFAQAVERVHVVQPVFILGHHRSGTTHLWNLLGRDGRFVSPTLLEAVFPHTMLTAVPAMAGPASLMTPSRRPQDNVRLGVDEPIEEERAICAQCFLSMQMARHLPRQRGAFAPYLTMRDASPAQRDAWRRSLDTFARKLLVRAGGGTVLFKSPDHTGKIALIREVYPDARLVFIHRDPYEVFASTRRMERATLPLYQYQRPRADTLDEFILWRYRAMHEAYLEDRDRLPWGTLVEVAFDSLREDPMGEVRRIYDELGLGGFEAMRGALERYVRSLAGYRMNRYPPLDDATRRRVASAWDLGFEAWGYAR